MSRGTRQPGDRRIVRRLAMALLVGLCVFGGFRIVQGVWIPVKAVVAQVLLESAFDRSLATHHAYKPWPWADMAPVARLSVPRLDVDSIVLNTDSGQAMAFGPTHLPASAALNTSGTAVIAAHRDTHFRFLKNLHTGDVVTVETIDGETRRYRVTGTRIVRWDQFAIPETAAVQRLALATCYPFNATHHGPLRYVVYALAIADNDNTTSSRQQSKRVSAGSNIQMHQRRLSWPGPSGHRADRLRRPAATG